MKSIRAGFAAAALLALLPVFALAQAGSFTVDRIFGSRDFASGLETFVWSPDGWLTLADDGPDGSPALMRVNARTGAREPLIRGSELVPAGATKPIDIESYEFSADGKKVLIFTNSIRVWRDNTRGTYYVFDTATRRLIPVSAKPGYQMFAKFSPDARLVGFVRDNNLFVTDITSGVESQLTTDGSDNIINGTTDWVYEEELGIRDAFRFSPDSKRIAFWRFDQSPIKPFYLLDELTLYPTLQSVRYPKAGTPNSKVQIGYMDLEAKSVRWLNIGNDPESYIAEMGFAGNAEELWLTRLNRHQNRLDLLMGDLRTGTTRVVMTDADSAWVDANVPTWIKNGQQFVYLSERDGYAHLFLFNRDGSLVRKLTTGNWDVRAFAGVDEKNGVAWFTSAQDGPTQQTVHRVGLDGRNLTKVSAEAGWHAVSFDPTWTYYIDTWSRAGVPPTQTLRTVDGKAVRSLADNVALAARMTGLKLNAPEFIKVPGGDGAELNAYLIKPRDFSAGRRYPVLMYVYGGPGSQEVVDAWRGTRYLWHQMLAQDGYVIAVVDNRGTGGRGSKFKKATYLRLGALESADQIAAAKHLATLPYVDGGRIGIWGWSYGGYMSSLSLFKGGETFKAALAVAPVTDWSYYDTIYTERYMRTPQENPEGYARTGPMHYVDSLRNGRLLLVHGTGDDNVHPQNTFQLIQKLEAANKQFDMRLYPNRTHSISGGNTAVNLYGYFTEWVKEHLGEQRSPMP